MISPWMRNVLGGLATLCMISPAGAIEITTKGVGVNHVEARQRALANALEEARGVLLSSYAKVKGDEYSEEITTAALGYVESFTPVSMKTLPDGNVEVILNANVSSKFRPIKGRESPDVESISDEDRERLGLAILTLQEQEAFLKKEYGDPLDVLQNGYHFTFMGYQIDTPSPKGVSGSYQFHITYDRSYWNNYKRILESVSPDKTEDYYTTWITRESTGWCLTPNYLPIRLPYHWKDWDIKGISVGFTLPGIGDSGFKRLDISRDIAKLKAKRDGHHDYHHQRYDPTFKFMRSNGSNLDLPYQVRHANLAVDTIGCFQIFDGEIKDRYSHTLWLSRKGEATLSLPFKDVPIDQLDKVVADPNKYYKARFHKEEKSNRHIAGW